MKTRIISAIVALIIVVPLIALGGIYYTLGICLIAALGYKEIIDLPKSHGKIPNTMIFIGLISILTLILCNEGTSIYKGFTYQIIAMTSLFLIVPTVFYKEEDYSSKDAFFLLGAVLFLGLVFNAFLTIRLRNLNTFLFLLIIPMVNDIFAYLIGSKFGKNKMCVNISPNKTWEGSIGGLVLGSASGIIFYRLLIGRITLKIVIITLILSIIGQIGDLIMSRIKRENGIKDFSNIMSGHGGILDRLDSSIFVFITYIFLLMF